MGGYDAEYTSVWKIWPSTSTEMPSDGNFAPRSERNVSIYAAKMATSTHLIAPATVLGPYQLPNVLLKFLSSKRHSVHAERTQRRWRIEEPGQNLDVGYVVCGIDRLKEKPPFYVRRGQEISTGEGKSHVPRPKCRYIELSQATTDPFTVYNSNQHHSSTPSRHQATKG